MLPWDAVCGHYMEAIHSGGCSSAACAACCMCSRLYICSAAGKEGWNGHQLDNELVCPPAMQGTVDGVAGMLSIDTWTYVSLVGVAGVLAPLLEETVFRCVLRALYDSCLHGSGFTHTGWSARFVEPRL